MCECVSECVCVHVHDLCECVLLFSLFTIMKIHMLLGSVCKCVYVCMCV